ncbi:MAG: DUF2726 domain-containing protein [Roseococcus sp.]
MSPALSVLVQEPALPIALLLIGIATGVIVERVRSKLRRVAWRKRNRPRWGREPGPSGGFSSDWGPQSETGFYSLQRDAADQLRIVMDADFTIQPLLNKSEARVLKELEHFVDECNPDWQVMVQVSLGEILLSKNVAAYRCINSKRVDLLLVDDSCMPRHAIEYQGAGHYQGAAAARDAVKKEALRRAGVGYHEVIAGQTTPSELRRLVDRLVARPPASSS